MDQVQKMQSAFELSYKTLQKMVDGFYCELPNLIIGGIVLYVVLNSSSYVRRAVIAVGRKSRLDPTLCLALGSLASFCTVLGGSLIVCVIVLPSFKPGHLIAGLGITSVAIGFAFQDILRNFFAGLLLLYQKPFRIGDEIKTGPFEGTVEEIAIRSTLLRTASGEVVIVPNGSIYTDPIIVNTASGHRRVKLTVNLDPKYAPDNERPLILKVVEGVEGVLDEPAPRVYLSSADPANQSLDIYFWCAPQQLQMQAITDLVAAAIRAELRGVEPVAGKREGAVA